jgi:hypothetical protein
MAHRRDETLRSLLKKTELPQTPAQFTSEVMREIEAMAHDEVYTDSTLKSALQRNSPVMPAADFTYKVLNRTRHPLPAPVYPPVIGKKIWIAVGLFVLTYIIAAIAMGRGTSGHTDLPYTIPITSYVRNFTVTFSEPLSYLGLILFTACLLLGLDYFFKKRSRGMI